MSTSTTLRSRLLGAWALTSYSAHLPTDPRNKIYPMGPQASGIILYTSDGYMSAQLHASVPSPPSIYPYAAYTGAFYLDESPGDAQGRPILLHEMRTSNLPRLVGDVQRRIVRITDEKDGTYLNLGLDGLMEINGEGRVVEVKWKRLEDNSRGGGAAGEGVRVLANKEIVGDADGIVGDLSAISSGVRHTVIQASVSVGLNICNPYSNW